MQLVVQDMGGLMNLEVTTVVKCIEDSFHVIIRNLWQRPAVRQSEGNS